MKTYESEQKVQAGFLDTLAGRLSREERDAANRLKEIMLWTHNTFLKHPC